MQGCKAGSGRSFSSAFHPSDRNINCDNANCLLVGILDDAAIQTRVMAETAQGFCPRNASHETLRCQFTNMPLGFSFQAHTCSV